MKMVKRTDLRSVNFKREMVSGYTNGMFLVEKVGAYEKKYRSRPADDYDNIVDDVLIIGEGGTMVDYPRIAVSYEDVRKVDTTKYDFVGYSKDYIYSKKVNGMAVFAKRS